jgi:hypothetical protein
MNCVIYFSNCVAYVYGPRIIMVSQAPAVIAYRLMQLMTPAFQSL